MARYGDQEICQFRGAEMIAEQWDISREDMEVFALESHTRARTGDQPKAASRRRSCPWAMSPSTRARARTRRSRRWRRCARWSKAAGSPPRCRARSPTRPSAMLVASEQAVKEHGLTPRARVHHISCRGADPVIMLDRADPRHRVRARRRPACRSTTSTWSRSTRRSRRSCWRGRRRPAPTWRRSTSTAARSRSATRSAPPAVRLMTTLLYELERTGGRYGLQTMCEGGGQANVTIIEKL